LEYDPWLVLTPEEVEEGGEIAADLAAMLDYCDTAAAGK
jgi:hypothetical protein